MTSNDFCDLTMGERLQDLMKERKITQSQLANGAGVSQSQISAICRDEERKINHLAIYKICKYLNISADWLLGLIPPNIRKPDPSLQAACEYTGLSEKAIENIHEITMAVNDINKELEKYTIYEDENEHDNAAMLDVFGYLLDEFLSTSPESIIDGLFVNLWKASYCYEMAEKHHTDNALHNLAIDTKIHIVNDGNVILSAKQSGDFFKNKACDYLRSTCEVLIAKLIGSGF